LERLDNKDKRKSRQGRVQKWPDLALLVGPYLRKQHGIFTWLVDKEVDGAENVILSGKFSEQSPGDRGKFRKIQENGGRDFESLRKKPGRWNQEMVNMWVYLPVQPVPKNTEKTLS